MLCGVTQRNCYSVIRSDIFVLQLDLGVFIAFKAGIGLGIYLFLLDVVSTEVEDLIPQIADIFIALATLILPNATFGNDCGIRISLRLLLVELLLFILNRSTDKCGICSADSRYFSHIFPAFCMC